MKNLEELKKIRDRVRKDLELRTGKHRIKNCSLSGNLRYCRRGQTDDEHLG